MAPKTSPKKDFVVSFGLQKPVAEILAAAEKSGMKLSRAYIDILRKKLGSGKGAPKRKPGRPKKVVAAAPAKRGPGRPKKSAAATHAVAAAAPAKRRGRPPKSASSHTSGDSAFRSAAAHIVIESGAARARQLLEEVVSKIRSSAG